MIASIVLFAFIGIIAAVQVQNNNDKYAELLNKKVDVPAQQKIIPATYTMKRIGLVDLQSPKSKAAKPGSFCPTCVNFIGDTIDFLLQGIVNGLKGDCAELCGYLPTQLEATVCDFLCTIAGIEGFITLLQDGDPDPIWLCEEIDGICPINDHAAANITNLSVSPHSAAQGATFDIDIIFRVTNHIGTGQLVMAIQPPSGDGQQMGAGILLVETPPGIYQVNSKLDTSMMSMQEPFNAGTFQVLAQVCEGTCGSIHSHTHLLSQRQTDFVITMK